MSEQTVTKPLGAGQEATLDDVVSLLAIMAKRIQAQEATIAELVGELSRHTKQDEALVSAVSELRETVASHATMLRDRNQELVSVVDEVRELLANLPGKLKEIGQAGANRVIFALVKYLVVDRKERARLDQMDAIEEKPFDQPAPQQPPTNGETLIGALVRGIRGK